MNTPAHAVLNLVVLGRRERPETAVPIVVGAVVPDLPIVVFYAWAKLVAGLPESVIWSRAYFDPGWQAAVDLFNSLPLILLALLVAWRARWPRATALLASMALHVPEDLLVHHDDAHRHFYPFSDWRFVSPVSYWDPAHYGVIGSLVEAALVAVCGVILLRRFGSRLARGLVAGVLATYALYWVWVVVVWM